MNPPLRLNHGGCFTRAGSRSVPQGHPVDPCHLSCPPGTQQTGAVLHADLLELKYPFQWNSHGLLILISVEQKPGFITEGKPANRTAQWFQLQQPTSEPSSPVPAAPPRPATTGRCKVLPRINAWRALPRTKSTELGPSGTSVDLFATKHDELDDFMGFFQQNTQYHCHEPLGFPWDSLHLLSTRHRGRQRSAGDRENRGHCAATPGPRSPPTARAAAPVLQACPRHLGAQMLLRIHCICVARTGAAKMRLCCQQKSVHQLSEPRG